MPIVTVRVDEELKRKMEELGEVNWSEVTRRAIEKTVKELEAWQHIDTAELKGAASENDLLRRRATGWNSTAEIRRWRSSVGSG